MGTMDLDGIESRLTGAACGTSECLDYFPYVVFGHFAWGYPVDEARNCRWPDGLSLCQHEETFAPRMVNLHGDFDSPCMGHIDKPFQSRYESVVEGR